MFRRAPVFMYTGVISNWKAGSPYGFVKDTDTGASYFLHKDDIVDGSRNRVTSLPEGFRVEFDKAMFEGRTKAVAVTLRGGAPITSTGESNTSSPRRRDDRDRDDEDDFSSRRRDDRDDRRRDYDRDDRDDRRRDFDRDDRRRDSDRDDRRRDIEREHERELREYDKELSRIQGSLGALSRAAVNQANAQTKLYHGLVSIAAAKGIVVPSDEDAKAANTARWARWKETSGEMREAAKERRSERLAARREARESEGSSDSNSKPAAGKSTPPPASDSVDDMF